MLNGIYAASSGMQNDLVRLEILSNNTANMDTPGFKKAIAVTKSFTNGQNQSIQNSPNQEKAGAYVNEIKTDFTDGAQVFTGSDLNMSINNDGFFTIQTPNGLAYTRNGSFSVNSEGYLVTQNGYYVMGENGTINVGTAEKLVVNEKGYVFGDGKQIDSLVVTDFPKPYQMTRAGASMFYPQDSNQAFQVSYPRVSQGYLESSNITHASVMVEMVNMINVQRSFEANQKVVTIVDQAMGKTVNEIAKV